MRILDNQRIDKTSFSIVTLHSDLEDSAWLNKRPEERLEGLEILRQMWSDYDPDTERLQRVYAIIER
jgi:hypothetical protein